MSDVASQFLALAEELEKIHNTNRITTEYGGLLRLGVQAVLTTGKLSGIIRVQRTLNVRSLRETEPAKLGRRQLKLLFT